MVSFFTFTSACLHVYNGTCTLLVQCIGIGVDTSDPAMMALQLCYSNLKKALDSHITAVVSSSFSQCLLSSDIHSAIISTHSMPSGDKVNMFLNAVEKKIAVDSHSVKVFAGVLRDQGSYLSVIGNNLEKTYCEY